MTLPLDASPQLYNEDLAPAKVRNWGAFSIFNVWTSDVHSLWGYYLAASLFLFCGSFLNFIVAIGIGSLIAGWFIYSGLCDSPLGKTPALLGAILFALLVLAAYLLSQVFSGRGAYLHVGAIIGTIMVGNVFRVIMPAQRALVKAIEEGREPDPVLPAKGLLRSRHNNYFTLPVLFIMISNHYASTYGHPYKWAILTLIAAAGVLIRHFFNRRHKGYFAWPYPLAGAVLLGIVAWWTAPKIQALPKLDHAVTFNEVRGIIGQRCVTCHSAVPTFAAYSQPPAGVVFNTPAAIGQNAQRIYQQVVVNRIMPLGNITQMTDEERAVIAAWVAAGAPAQ
jgi:uncharacterized membrane protein